VKKMPNLPRGSRRWSTENKFLKTLSGFSEPD